MTNASFDTSSLKLSIDGLSLQFNGSLASMTLGTTGYTIVSPSAAQGTAKPTTDGVLQICATGSSSGRYNLITADTSVERGIANVAEFTGKTFYEVQGCKKPVTNGTSTSWLKFNTDGSVLYYDATATTPAQETVPAANVAAAFSTTGDGTPVSWMRMYKITVSGTAYYVMLEADIGATSGAYGSMWVESALIR